MSEARAETGLLSFGLWRPTLSGVCLFGLAACTGNGGDAVVDAGQVCGTPETFVNSVAGDAPEEIGLRFSADFLVCLVTSGEDATWSLDVTQKGVSSQPFNHAFVNWNPSGHPPPFVYDVPHMDVHFHMVTPQEREAYCTDVSPDQAGCLLLPGPDEIPLGYAPGEPAAGHGVHWLPSSSPEFSGEGFSSTLIYGSYDGDMIFIEPMVTSEFLLALPDGAQRFPIPQPIAVGRTGWYPQSYEIRYDEALRQYEILLLELQFREAA